MSTEEKKTSRPHQLKEGTLLKNRYRIEKVIGEGGFGITYFGRDEVLELDVAIKEYFPGGIATRHTETSSEVSSSSPDDEAQYNKGRDDFLKEARTLAKFQTVPGIVSVKDFFEDNNTAYIVMERLVGTDLRTWLSQKGVMTFKEAFSLLSPVMTSLAKVHEAGLIHRDISPANILVQQDGSVKLLDFGAARAINKTGDLTLSVVLKPGYSPEEQYRTKGLQGPWTDVYSLCATIYRMITGMQPDDSLQRLLLDEIKTPTELGIQLDPGIENVLMKGLAIRGEDRWQSMTELRNAFIACDPTLGTPTPVVPPSGAVKADDTDAESYSRDIVPSYSVPGDKNPAPKKSKGPVIGIIAGIAAAAVALVIILNPFGGSGSGDKETGTANITDTVSPGTETAPVQTESQTQPVETETQTQSVETETQTQTDTPEADPILQAAGLNLFYGVHEYQSGYDAFMKSIRVRTLATTAGDYTISALPFGFFCFKAEDGTDIIALDYADEIEYRYIVFGKPSFDGTTLTIEPTGAARDYYDELLSRKDEFDLDIESDAIQLLDATDTITYTVTSDHGTLRMYTEEYSYSQPYSSPYSTLSGAAGSLDGSTGSGPLYADNVEVSGIWVSDKAVNGSECEVTFTDGGKTQDAAVSYVGENIQVVEIGWTKVTHLYNGHMAEFEGNSGIKTFTYFNTAPFGFIMVPWNTNDIYYFQQPLKAEKHSSY